MRIKDEGREEEREEKRRGGGGDKTHFKSRLLFLLLSHVG